MDSDEDGSLKVPWRRKDSQSPGKVKGLCDVCELPDGDSGLNLQKCADCGMYAECRCDTRLLHIISPPTIIFVHAGVCVHDQCYGIVHDNDEDEEDKKLKLIDWKCHPCSGLFLFILLFKRMMCFYSQIYLLFSGREDISCEQTSSSRKKGNYYDSSNQMLPMSCDCKVTRHEFAL